MPFFFTFLTLLSLHQPLKCALPHSLTFITQTNIFSKYSAVTCSGHFSYDNTPFKNIFDEDNTVYTNAELYELLNPSRDEFPYIYDNFRWSHCTFLGYDMTGLDVTTVPSATT